MLLGMCNKTYVRYYYTQTLSCTRGNVSKMWGCYRQRRCIILSDAWHAITVTSEERHCDSNHRKLDSFYMSGLLSGESTGVPLQKTSFFVCHILDR